MGGQLCDEAAAEGEGGALYDASMLAQQLSEDALDALPVPQVPLS